MAALLTYNNIIDTLRDLANRSEILKGSFFIGKPWDLENSEEIQYPVLQVYPTVARMPLSINGSYNTIQINMNMRVVDLVENSQDNLNDVHSDMLQLAQDIANEISQNPYYSNSNLKILNDIEITNIEEYEDSDTAGWQFDLNFQMRNHNAFCGLPFDPISGVSYNGPISTGYTYTATLTCSDLVNCPIIIEINNEITDIYSVLSGLTGGTISTGNYWTSGSTGNNSIKAINETGLDATADYAVAIGSGTTAQSQSSFAAGVGSVAKSSDSVTLNKNVFSAITITNNDPLYNMYGVVFNGDVSAEWQDYLWSYCSTFTLYGGSGSTYSFDCSTLNDIYYDFGSDKTYIIDTSLVDNSFTSISGNTDYSALVQYPAFAMGTGVQALGNSSFATGTNSDAEGANSFAGGDSSYAQGNNSHAEGNLTTARGTNSHTEGYLTKAEGAQAHAEGSSTLAQGADSHAEGNATKASGPYSHSEGQGTTASGYYSHAEGTGSIASTDGAHAEGFATLASGIYGSHSEGSNTTASGLASHAEGGLTTASGIGAHSEGFRTTASGDLSHAGGGGRLVVPYGVTLASGYGSFVHGSGSTASGNYSIVLGCDITGNTYNTVYVPFLNIKNLPTGTAVNNLGIDSNGNVIIGNAGGSTFTGGTVTGATTFTTGVTSNQFYVSGFNPSVPGYSNAIDTNTGLMFDGPDVLSLHTGGIQALLINAAQQVTNGGIPVGSAKIQFTGGTVLDNLTSTTITVTTQSNLYGNIMTSFSGTTNRVVEAGTTGALTATKDLIDSFISSGSVTTLLSNVSNWSPAKVYTGTTITGTYQGQQYYDSTYYFVCVDDNDWIRIARA